MTKYHPVTTPHLILGAAKSGKSAYAEQLCTALPPPYTYIATAQILDDEMEARIRSHRARRSNSWQTIEAPFDLLAALQSQQGKQFPVLVDCLTLWLSNLLLTSSDIDSPQTHVSRLCSFLPDADYPLFLVSNEVGAGIVPDNPLARSYRDLAGHANQAVAAACRLVSLVVAGLPLRLK